MSLKNVLKGISISTVTVLMSMNVYSIPPKIAEGDSSSSDAKARQHPIDGIKEAFYTSSQQKGMSREEAQVLLEMRRRQLMPDSLLKLLLTGSHAPDSAKRLF